MQLKQKLKMNHLLILTLAAIVFAGCQSPKPKPEPAPTSGVRYNIEKTVSVVSHDRKELEHLRVNITAPELGVTNLPVATVVAHYLKVWNAGNSPAACTIAVKCSKPARLLVIGKALDPERFGAVTVSHVSPQEIRWTLGRLDPKQTEREEFFMRLTVAGPNGADTGVVVQVK